MLPRRHSNPIQVETPSHDKLPYRNAGGTRRYLSCAERLAQATEIEPGLRHPSRLEGRASRVPLIYSLHSYLYSITMSRAKTSRGAPGGPPPLCENGLDSGRETITIRCGSLNCWRPGTAPSGEAKRMRFSSTPGSDRRRSSLNPKWRQLSLCTLAPALSVILLPVVGTTSSD